MKYIVQGPITDALEQEEISNQIMDIAESNSQFMNSENVKKTSEIIDKLLDFDDGSTFISDEVLIQRRSLTKII